MKRASAFTLIELLVVVAIISLLVSMLVPSMHKAKELARRAICSANIHHLGVSMVGFAEEHGGYLPGETGMEGIWYDHPLNPRAAGAGSPGYTMEYLWDRTRSGEKGLGYLGSKEIMRCPSRTDHWPVGTPDVGHLYVENKGWEKFESTYIAVGGSCTVYDPLAENPDFRWAFYRVRIDLHEPDHALMQDWASTREHLLHDYVAWRWFAQSNHWENGMLTGANVLRVDGGVQWINYSEEGWHRWNNSHAPVHPNGSYYLYNGWWQTPAAEYYHEDGRGCTKPSRGILTRPPAS